MDPETERLLETKFNLCPGCKGLPFSGANLFPEHSNLMCDYRYTAKWNWVHKDHATTV